jgi:hypothetical protein
MFHIYSLPRIAKRQHPAVRHVTSIWRRPVGILHPKLIEVLHRDFADCSALAQALSDQHAALFCLGTYTGAVPDAELRTITVDYTLEFAHDKRQGRSGRLVSADGRSVRYSAPRSIALMPRRRNSAASWSSPGLPAVSSVSPTKIELAPANKHMACISSVMAVRPAERRT